MKTSLAALALALATPAGAIEQASPPETALFATCAGRYSATMEAAWLDGGDGAEAQARRAVFLALLEAAAPAPPEAPMLLDLRIRAKQAQAQLLTRAILGRDGAEARRAAAMARRELRLCEALLLP